MYPINESKKIIHEPAIMSGGGYANIIGNLGSVMFPSTTISAVVPVLLTLGAVFVSKINDDMTDHKDIFKSKKILKPSDKTHNQSKGASWKPITIKQIKKMLKR